jgi:hypothetical protein
VIPAQEVDPGQEAGLDRVVGPDRMEAQILAVVPVVVVAPVEVQEVGMDPVARAVLGRVTGDLNKQGFRLPGFIRTGQNCKRC